MSGHTSHRFVGLLLTLVFASAAGAADWAQYRGPNSDGSTPETIRTNWSSAPPKVLWKQPLGPGWSAISVAQGRAVTQAKRVLFGEAREVVLAFDPATGAELWSTSVGRATYTQSLSGAAPDSLDGPRSTPSLAGDRVFVISSYLKVFCLDAATGTPIWMRDLVAESGATLIPWNNGASPLVVGDLLFLNSSIPNRTLTALRIADGTTAWAKETDPNTHATPCFARLAGVPQVIFLTMRGLVGVLPETGAIQWRYSFTPSSTSTAATPLVAGDLVYASCAYGKGAWTTRVIKNGENFLATQTKFQQATEYQNHWATPVAHEDALYSIVERGADRSLTCYDLAGRNNRWRVETVGSASPGYASLIKAGDTLVVLTESGELVLVKPGTTYQEIDRFKALNAYCWNQPTVAGGRLFARSSSEIVALDVAATPALPPAIELRAEADRAGATVRLVVRAGSGDSLEFAANRLELQTSEDGGRTWILVPVRLVANAGNLEQIVPMSGATQLFRVQTVAANRNF